MEFRWLVQTALSVRRPLLSLPYSSSPCSLLASVPNAHPTLAIRRFSQSSSRPSTDNSPLPTATETAESAPKAETITSTKSSKDSMEEIFNLVAKTSAGPKYRDFSAILPSEYNSPIRSGINPNSPPLGVRPIPRTGPSAGRSVPVIADLPQALARLRGIITANNVKADQIRQRFHEKPGMKKKRLKSLRHRRRFKAGFKRLVEIVMDMKRKGL